MPGGVRLLREAGLRLVTLSNGSAGVADRLLAQAGIRGEFEHLLSVEHAPAWKPAPAAYAYAARACSAPIGQMLLVGVHPWDICARSWTVARQAALSLTSRYRTAGPAGDDAAAGRAGSAVRVRGGDVPPHRPGLGLAYSALDFEAAFTIDIRDRQGNRSVRPHFKSVRVRAVVSIAEPLENLAAVIEETEARCPVLNLLSTLRWCRGCAEAGSSRAPAPCSGWSSRASTRGPSSRRAGPASPRCRLRLVPERAAFDMDTRRSLK